MKAYNALSGARNRLSVGFFATFVLVLCKCALSLPAAVINYVGTQTDLGPHWRTNSTAKPLDIDNNNVLGSDGYDLINRPVVTPGYVSQMTILSSTTGGDPSYAFIDNPTSLPATFQTGTMNPDPGTGVSANLFTFTMNSGVSGRRVRVSLMVDNLDNPIFNAASLTLVQTSGNGAGIASVATTSAVFNDQVPDWVFFDIIGAQAGDTFVIRGVGGSSGYATLGGVAFDSSTRAPWMVTSLSDNGGGTLLGAIDSMVANDLVEFSNNLSGQVITLTNGEIELDQNVTIDASALPGGIQISGNNASRIFEVLANVTVTLNSLTIAKGVAPSGGGILNEGTLTLNHCSLVDNTVTNDGSGGGILNDTATLILNQCTVAGNSATSGGGQGGGIFNFSASTTLNQCTVSGNAAGSGGGIGGFTAITTNTVILFNSIVAGNSANTGTDTYNTAPVLLGTNFIGGNPQLGPLGIYGGPTPTKPPPPGSPVIDAGSDSATNAPYYFTTDQRGAPRLVGAHVDIGAAEMQMAVVTTNADFGPGSLRAVLNTNYGGIVTFATNLSGQTILLTGGEFELNNSWIIDASALPSGIQLNGNQASRILEVPGNVTVTLNSLTITNGNGNGIGGPLGSIGGGILNEGTLTLNNCSVVGNIDEARGNYAGGGIFNDGNGSLTLNQSTVAGNSAGSGGGLNNSGQLTLNQSTVSGNASDLGGGIWSNNSFDVFNSIVAGNSGSDISLEDANLTVTGTNLIGGNPLLAPLGNYGGPVPTMPPMFGSPAIDAGSDSALATPYTFTTDQRGYPRPSGAHVDIGAVEAQYAPANNPPMLISPVRSTAGGTFQFAFTNVVNADFTTLTATNLALPLTNWTALGNIPQTAPGQYQFTDPGATNARQRFYRVVGP